MDTPYFFIRSRETTVLPAIRTQNILMVELLLQYKARVNFPPGDRSNVPLYRKLQKSAMSRYSPFSSTTVDDWATDRRDGTSVQLSAMGGKSQ